MQSFFFLIGFSFRQLARVRQMVGIAVALLLMTAIVIGLVTSRFGWDRTQNRLLRVKSQVSIVTSGLSLPVMTDEAIIRSSETIEASLKESVPKAVFSRWVVFFLFLGFLMPLWSLSFASSALGTDRESRSLIWLLTRPIPRSSIYLAKFLAVLPWCIALNLGGFALICFCGGQTGQEIFALYWQAVLAGTFAFTAIFHLVGAIFPRPAIVGLLYAFFFETVLSELPVPGTLKRLSINYYTRCLMYSSAREEGIPTESEVLFVPVSDLTAWIVLIATTIGLTVLGMWLFGKMEYREET